MQTTIQKRSMLTLSVQEWFDLMVNLLTDTGYADEDGYLTPLGEEYLAAIKNEAEVETFDLPLTTVNNLSAPGDGNDEAEAALDRWVEEMEADDVS